MVLSTIRRRLTLAAMLALSLVLALPIAVFIPTGAHALAATQETLTVPFVNGQNGATTTNSYSGLVTIRVSGYGQEAGTKYSDAFYIFTDDAGNPVTPYHLYGFGLWINYQPVENYLAAIPPYSSSHTYQFTISVGSNPQQITFGIGDTYTVDNTGSFTITVKTTTNSQSYDPGNYAGKSGNVSVGSYNEPNDYQHRNYCGPGASQVLISAWTSNVPDIETLATQEKTNPNSGTLMKNMVGPINNTIGQSYYSVNHASSQADFSNMIGRDILDNHHPLITGILTIYHNNKLNGWTVSANHIITIYGFDFSSPTVGYIYYYDTSGTVAGTTATGPNRIDYNVFWSLVQQLNIQLS